MWALEFFPVVIFITLTKSSGGSFYFGVFYAWAGPGPGGGEVLMPEGGLGVG